VRAQRFPQIFKRQFDLRFGHKECGMNLKDKVALISGGNSGIGRATALLFAAEGAKVFIAARNEDKGRETVNEIEALGRTACFARCDVRRAQDCRRVVEECVARFGRLDILFNNAGVVPFGTVEETDEATWDLAMDTNVKGVFLMSRAAIPIMRSADGGVIVNNASDWGIVGGAKSAAYCASKGAVVLLTKAMAIDHAPERIRINAVCPGETHVTRWDERADDIAALVRNIPLGRVANPEEIAQAVLFLASDQSSFMTGAALSVDGGYTAR
jgi:NAD(P)-dependent dehydrogenase (short-subunit alcohol dehydrogenase family)